MEDYDDDFTEDDFDEEFFTDDCLDGADMEGHSVLENVDKDELSSDVPFTLEQFTFWGGYLGISLDEERMERRLKKKKKDSEDVLKREEDF
jgi:hypothetical protein